VQLNVAVVNESTSVPTKTVHQIVSALERQDQDLSSAWALARSKVHYAASLASVPAGYAVMALINDSDQADALGYHDVTPDGRPYAKVFTHPILGAGGTLIDGSMSVSACASHEFAELKVDPGAQLFALYDNAGHEIAYEVCDVCEDAFYNVALGSGPVAVSDFVLPTYFNPLAPGPYDFMGLLTKPAPALLRGGYAIITNEKGEKQIFGEIAKWRLPAKLHGSSRSAKRMGGVADLRAALSVL
jgi:hypothetical protein